MARADNSYIRKLVRNAKSGSTDAFCSLYASTCSGQYELACCFLLGDRKNARLVTKEIYITAHFLFSEIYEDSFITWLNRTNLKLCCAISGGEGQSTGIDGISFRQILALPGNEGPAFFLKYMRGMHVGRIADVLNIGLADAVSCLRSAESRLCITSDFTPIKRRLRAYRLDRKSAKELLDEILEGCSLNRYSTSYSVLETYSIYRKELFKFGRIASFLVILAFIFIPFFFAAPDFTVEPSVLENSKACYTVKISNLIPVKSVNASVDSEGLSVKQTGKGRYEITADKSGELKIMVRLVNGQYRVASTNINISDTDPPVLLGQRLESDKVILEFEDSGRGIDYDGIYASGVYSGGSISPIEYGKGYAVFEIPCEKTNVFIPDLNGNTLYVIIKP